MAKPKSDGVCEIKKEDELSEYSVVRSTSPKYCEAPLGARTSMFSISDLLRFDKNNFVTNKIYKTFDLKDTKFAVPVTGIYELQLR